MTGLLSGFRSRIKYGTSLQRNGCGMDCALPHRIATSLALLAMTREDYAFGPGRAASSQ